MNRIKDIFLKSKYELLIFAALSMNFLLFFTKDDMMSDILYPLHLVDLRIGFISRTLVGSISGLLWKNPTEGNIAFLQTAVIIITFLLTAVFLGGCIKKADEESAGNLLIISLLVAVFPYGFMTYINLFELLDIYWVMSAVLCLLSSENKKTAFLIPVFIFTGLWVHYSFVFAFMPLIYVLCFSEMLRKKSKASYILTGITVIVSVSFTLYFVSTCRTFNVMPFEDFIDYIIDKAGSEITSIERYIGTAFRPNNEMNKLYGFTEAAGLDTAMAEKMPEALKGLLGNFQMALRDTSLFAIICDFILISPVLSFFSAIWIRAMKNTEDKKEKFIYFLCTISPLIQLFSCFISSDTSRWLSLMVISDLFMLAYFLKNKAAAVTDSTNGIMIWLKNRKAVIIPVLVFYLTIVFVW